MESDVIHGAYAGVDEACNALDDASISTIAMVRKVRIELKNDETIVHKRVAV